METLAIAVHGGAWNIPKDQQNECLQGVQAALQCGWELLQQGRSALDAAVATVLIMEDFPAFDAGYGSHLTRDGNCELDASIMEGRYLNVGAVCSVKRLKNPILAAKELLYEPQILISGEGAERFAESRGIPTCDPSELIHPREESLYRQLLNQFEKNPNLHVPETASDYMHRPGSHSSIIPGIVPRGTIVCNSEPSDTVGAVCRDKSGWIVVATSTGGTKFKPAGRIGDSPLVGCGFYALDSAGGAGCTGAGELISRCVLSKFAVEQMERGASAQEAAELAMRELDEKLSAEAGVICVDAQGRPAAAHSTEHMAYGLMSSKMAEMLVSVD